MFTVSTVSSNLIVYQQVKKISKNSQWKFDLDIDKNICSSMKIQYVLETSEKARENILRVPFDSNVKSITDALRKYGALFTFFCYYCG